MRISTNMVYEKAYRNLTLAFDRFIRLQEKMATGKRINRPSDAPADVPQDLLYRKEIKDSQEYQSIINHASSWMSVADTSLSNVVQLLNNAKAIALQQGSDSADEQTRMSAALQVDSLISQIVQLANTRHGNRYIFSGYKTRTQPFSRELVAGKEVVRYNGDDGVMFIEIGKGVKMQLNQIGKDIFSNPDTEIQGANVNSTSSPITGSTPLSTFNGGSGVNAGTVTIHNGNQTAVITVNATDTVGDILQAINNAGINVEAEINQDGTGINIRSLVSGTELRVEDNQTARDLGIVGVAESEDIFGVLLRLKDGLESNDSNKILKAANQIDSVLDKALQAWVEVGTRAKRLEMTRTKLGSETINTTELLSEIEDADMADVTVKLAKEQNIYQSLLKSITTIIQPSLLDFLK